MSRNETLLIHQPAREGVDTDGAESVGGEGDHGVDAGRQGDPGHGVHPGHHQPPEAGGQVPGGVEQGRGEEVQGAPGQPREAQLEIGPLEVQLRRHEDVGAQEVPFSDSHGNWTVGKII